LGGEGGDGDEPFTDLIKGLVAPATTAVGIRSTHVSLFGTTYGYDRDSPRRALSNGKKGDETEIGELYLLRHYATFFQ